jgi:SPP1 family predicted phage head-tail adaptor
MRAGDLDRRITVERLQAGEPNDFNEVVEAWTVLATLWAKVAEERGREFLASESQIVGEAKAVFTIRYRADLRVTDRLRHSGRIWNIRSIREIGRREGLEIMATAAA